MHEYDAALKLLLQSSADLTMRQLAGVPIHKWLNVEFPEVQSTRVDLLGETDSGDLVHIELQSTNDPKMALRMAEYCLRVYRIFGKLPRQVLLYVGEDPMRMQTALNGPDLSFRYRIVDVRELDGETLLQSDRVGDNVIAVLARLQDHREAVRRIVSKIAGLAIEEREAALKTVLVLSGLRHLGTVIEEEARKVPILNDILQHEVLGREFNKGRQEGRQEGLQEGRQEEAAAMLRRQITARFGPLPSWAEDRLANKSTAELEELGIKLLTATTVEELLS